MCVCVCVCVRGVLLRRESGANEKNRLRAALAPSCVVSIRANCVQWRRLRTMKSISFN